MVRLKESNSMLKDNNDTETGDGLETVSEVTGLNGATLMDSRVAPPEVSDNEIVAAGLNARP